MKPWLEDLSEEWIPVPTPVQLAPKANNPSATQKSQSVPPKPRSRLPRLRNSSGSSTEIQIRPMIKEKRPLQKARTALAERSLSDNNIAATGNPDASNHAQSRSTSRSFSASSPNSVIYNGTVEQKPAKIAPEKNGQMQNTPEWRRRLLKGDIGYGDQRDLFSPMGLENIFQKPTEGASEETKQSKSNLGLFKGLSAMPSSPPPWPSREQEQEGQTETAQRNGDHNKALNHGLPSRMQRENQDPQSQDGCNALEDSPRAQDDKLDAVNVQEGLPRTVSGQLEFENEKFSPVFLSMNHKIGGYINPVAANLRGSELAERLRHIGSPPPSFAHQLPSEGNTLSESGEDSSYAKLRDDTLPEDLPAGTPDIADVGRFVEMKRGGYSQDGSFRRRPLSPSPRSKAATRNLPGDQITATNRTNQDQENDSADVPPQAPSPPSPTPVTPRGQERSTHLSPERAHLSASPLKLFDAHDTFTSNRLQRRLSQLEYKSEKPGPSSTQVNRIESTKILKKSSHLTSVEEVSIQKVAAGANIDSSLINHHTGPRRLEAFGQGQLDEYQFPEDFSGLSSHDPEARESAPDDSPPADVAPPGSKQPLRFHSDGSPQLHVSSKAKRQGLTRVSNPFRAKDQSRLLSTGISSIINAEPEPQPPSEYAEGKRGPTSPFKNPTPKRRRTLHAADGDDVFSDSGLKSVKDTHVTMQSVIGRKRKDARHDHSTDIADPEVLARRHILRPRNPTPSQRRRDEIQAEILEATEAFILSSPKLNTIREQLDSPSGPHAHTEESRAAAVANEVAAFSMTRIQGMKDEGRKRSVTTQDFLDEAVKIMEFIRAKGRPTSGLGSLEETESESPIMQGENGLPSTPVTFSRPPSREGRRSGWREPNKLELDSHLMNHLQRFQEKESDDFMGSSIRSLRFGQMNAQASLEGNSIIFEQNNIRIIDNQDRPNRMYDNERGAIGSEPQTNGTHPSTGSSMGQTVVTNTSRRSEHVATLAPEAVAHLIPEQIAGMSFDREKNLWVKRKSPAKEQPPTEERSSVNDSEDDPFGNIPDLTVDETTELMIKKGSPCRPKATAETFVESEEVDRQDRIRPTTREGKAIPFPDTSSVPSKASNFAWSYPKTETRATSWTDQETRNGGTQKMQQAPTTYSIPESDEDDVEHEIKYFEGRSTTKQSVRNARVRDITISISSPRPPREDHFGVRGVEHTGGRSSPQRNYQPKWENVNTCQGSHSTKTAWRQMTGVRTLPTSRVPPLVEEGELSILDDLPSRNYRMQLSMSVSAPVLGAGRQDALVHDPSSPARPGDVTFMLSDLPEFTLHQVDECEIPDRVVVKHDGTRFSKSLEDRYALGTAELVKALQDVEPDEPYWEDLREVSLHDKGLSNLHRLDEFCYRLEDLDMSDNSISQVKGVPFTIRRLKAQNNCLTGLTSWTTLMNLQYLDVSSNDIDSLEGLNQLVHLRTLKVDNNKLKSLNGVLHLDGLIELSAEGNEIRAVDFEKANLKSLVDLNLRRNSLSEVRNLHCLTQLQHIDLDDNRIDNFPLSNVPAARCSALRSLRLCRNGTTSLRVDAYCPKLESLYVDGNSLTRISGVEHLRHLRTFSARAQTLEMYSDNETCVGNLVRNADVRTLYISVNPIRSLDISQHLLNLQRLELASMGLKELPDNFGQLAPNIRSINLNFNSIKDLRPLLNIKRLNELFVARNKLGRLRTNLAVLGKLTTLAKLDMRDNPLTMRFYTSTVDKRVVSLKDRRFRGEESDRFLLPNGCQEADEDYLERLDDETRLRRRVHEMMLATSCKNLRELDGLPFDKARILVKDDIWERLLYLGIIRRSEKTEGKHE
ncbi:hypothetical protein K469DRAFT_658509 [Zopfia rhizophila CBS 207.26]|uniref:L domain-like protein n=1 Tax=Zopfia rhizophila CBS 207.26 TaxID=1314779 RepID=A0A6A6ECT3_9PEZI|nr:hypothetical protein K469DRAFT_658509 [Zopfia rhizophila CBS 207.26]